MRYQAIIEYDGTAYCGFQRQANGPSIQQELEQAIKVISDTETTVTGAGRTDSGVHAFGQVVAYDLDWSHGVNDLWRALNANLPDDIAVIRLSEANEDFHPRFDAKKRTYEYYIYNEPIRSPYYRRTSWHVSQQLDIDRMNLAAKAIVGSHDFATFGRPPQGDNSVRQVFRAEWVRDKSLLIFTIEANAFLYRMVRSLVGSMKVVGEGSWTVSEFIAALKARDRDLAAQTAPPHALFLTAVSYD
jgi:tRNA pseudouridine38-40 synthase